MSISELNGLTLSIVDEKLIEQLGFVEDKVIATLGIEGEYVCGPVLPIEITGDCSAVIGDDDLRITLNQVEVLEDIVKCTRNGESAEYEIIARAEGSLNKRYLP